MRSIVTILLSVSIAALSTACSTMTVRADHDSQVDFSSFNSFALFERPAKERRGPQMSELVDRRIASSMETSLEGKGFTPTTPREADLLVTFYTAVRKRVTVNGGGWYGYRRPYWGGGVTYVNSYPEGTLVIDVIDRKSRNLVWRGVGAGAFSKMNPSYEKVDKRVTRILQTFPPVN
ncbi:MAG: DUF4136 domain-containing protein [Acidobacteriota bacterium]|nr:DUF4136 domain-containing protein [Acidobacteriota bacterium]